MPVCNGCMRYFNHKGYRMHIGQTQNPSCLALYVAQQQAFPGLDDDAMDVDNDDDDDDNIGAFAGDFFGTDYTSDDFPGFEEAAADSDLPDEAWATESDTSEDPESEAEPELESDPESNGSVTPEPVQPDPADNQPDNAFAQADPSIGRIACENNLREEIDVVHCKCLRAGEVTAWAEDNIAHARYENNLKDHEALYWPFKSRLDYAIARWSKLRGPSSSALDELLSIEGVSDALGLQYKNSRELNKIVDALPKGRPPFIRQDIELANETYEVYFRNILECAQSLYGNPEFASHLIFKPEKHFRKGTKTRLYHDMHTGRWWWTVQKEVEHNEPGATIIPIIIASDKTKVTLFGNKSAYPVYMTIGNIPKEIRRKPSRQAWILLGYIPVTKLSQVSVKASRRRALLNLTHAALSIMLKPLKKGWRKRHTNDKW